MREYLLSVFECAVAKDSSIYVSIPITTGKDFLRWYSAKGRHLASDNYAKAHMQDVIEANVSKGRQFVNELRSRFPGKVIIEPTSLIVPNWSQQEYISFWIEVINKYVSAAYFTPGWYYSRGCAAEFLASIEKKIMILDVKDQPISLSTGVKDIDSAVQEYRDLQLETDFLLNITSRLKSLSKE